MDIADGNITSDAYVNESGDTMTGALTINTDSNTVLSLDNLTGTNNIVNFKDNGTQVFLVEDGGFVGIGNVNPWQELTISGDETISDDTPNLEFRDSDSNAAYMWHLDTATANAPWQNLALWRGTDSGSGFSINPGTPLIYFKDNNDVNFPTADVNIINDLDVTGGAGFGSNGKTSSTELVDINNVWTTTTGTNYNLLSTLQVEPAVTSSGHYRAIGGNASVETARTISAGVIGVFGLADAPQNIAANLTGTQAANGLIGGYFSANAKDMTVAYTAGVFFDIPGTDDGAITTAYGLRIGGTAITGTGSIANIYGLYFPSISEASSRNFDIFHSGDTPKIAVNNNKTLTWVDFGSNTMMSITDAGTTGTLTVTGGTVFNSTSGTTTITGNTNPIGRLLVPMGEVSYFSTSGTAVVIAAQSDGSTNMVVVNPVTTLNNDAQFDNGGANNGRLRYTGTTTKTFHIACTISIAPDTAADTFVLGIAKNGTVVAASKVLQKITNVGDTQSTALHVMASLATNDYLELYVGNTTDADDLVIKTITLFAMGM